MAMMSSQPSLRKPLCLGFGLLWAETVRAAGFNSKFNWMTPELEQRCQSKGLLNDKRQYDEYSDGEGVMKLMIKKTFIDITPSPIGKEPRFHSAPPRVSAQYDEEDASQNENDQQAGSKASPGSPDTEVPASGLPTHSSAVWVFKHIES